MVGGNGDRRSKKQQTASDPKKDKERRRRSVTGSLLHVWLENDDVNRLGAFRPAGRLDFIDPAPMSGRKRTTAFTFTRKRNDGT
jgi:hypothetical protein